MTLFLTDTEREQLRADLAKATTLAQVRAAATKAAEAELSK